MKKRYLLALLLLNACGSDGPPPPPATAKLKLTWVDNSDNEDGFEIEKKVAAEGTYATLATVATNSTSYTDTGLTLNQAYCYRLRAFNTVGYSSYSNEACAAATATSGAVGIEL